MAFHHHDCGVTQVLEDGKYVIKDNKQCLLQQIVIFIYLLFNLAENQERAYLWH